MCVQVCGGSKTGKDTCPPASQTEADPLGQNTVQTASVGHIYIHTYTPTHILFLHQGHKGRRSFWPGLDLTAFLLQPFISFLISISHVSFLSKGLLDPQGLFSRPLSILCCSFPLSLTLFFSTWSLKEVH